MIVITIFEILMGIFVLIAVWKLIGLWYEEETRYENHKDDIK